MQSPRGPAAVRVLGPHSQLEEGVQEVLTAAQTSQSLVPGSTKAEAPRDERAIAWALGWPSGQEAPALHTAIAAPLEARGKFSQHLSVSSGHQQAARGAWGWGWCRGWD